MIICEYEFEKSNPKNPDHSLKEVEYYTWIPAGSMLSNHSLSLRKNLVTGKFEVYRRHYTIYAELENVVFRSSSLEEAIDFAHEECVKYHGKPEKDKVCKHEYPMKATNCERKRNVSASYCSKGDDKKVVDEAHKCSRGRLLPYRPTPIP